MFAAINLSASRARARARVCVCVCVRERERENAKWSVPQSVHLNVRNATIISAVLLEACEARDRERERETKYYSERYG
jgi:hypothetical protein